ncbi:MAG TPA: monofunctional biosynthetic peptidoglycan transglycosylase [Ignavibacteriaceae bacterium]|nr:monofunctional biosynthetic peptidoglycan transglycosylase [Ignavibacteriaceae bacterium]
MPSLQISENELGWLFEKMLPGIKKRKFQNLILYMLFLIYFSIPSFQIPLLEYSHVRISSLMEQRALEHDLIFYPHQSWVNINKVNPNLLKAIISMEDDDFFQHKGVDWKQLDDALKLNKRRKRIIRGGSTLTMQLAKNLYLTTERNVLRKAKELLITFRMEKEISKRAILQDYVNEIEWGDGIFGIKEASQKYFGRSPLNLTVNQCARLAAVIPSPLEHKPNLNSPYVLRRSSIILSRMNNVILFPKESL